jgi:Ino eighty subunit 2
MYDNDIVNYVLPQNSDSTHSSNLIPLINRHDHPLRRVVYPIETQIKMVSRPKRASAISYAERSPSSSAEGSGEDEIESEIEDEDQDQDGEEELEEEDAEGEADAEGEEEDVEDQMDLDAEGEDEEEGKLYMWIKTDNSPNARSCQDSI